MDVRGAVLLAKRYINNLFKDEGIINLGLEEVEFDENSSSWYVTIGFSRPWDKPTTTGLTPFAQQTGPLSRSYKVVQIDDIKEEVRSVKDRKTKS